MEPRARALLLLSLLMGVALAGCTGSDDGNGGDGTDGTDGGDGPGQPRTAEVPRWEIGDAWTYTVRTAEFPQTTSKMLVYGDDGNNYLIGVTDKQQALIHALFNVNPQLGRIQKGNLAVYEQGEPRPMYRFPFQDGDSWQTDLFASLHGGLLTAEATWSASIDTGLGTMPGFEVEARNPAGFTVTYDYIPELQWFSKLVVHDADGTLVHDLRVTDFERGASGTGHFVRGSDLFDQRFGPSGSAIPEQTTRQVLVDGTSDKGGEFGQYHLQAFNVQVSVPNPNNDRAEVRITDGDGDEVFARSFLQSQENEFKFQSVNATPGQWEVQVTLSGGATAHVRLAGAWAYSGSV